MIGQGGLDSEIKRAFFTFRMKLDSRGRDKEALQYFGVLRGLYVFILSGLWIPNYFSKDLFQFNMSSSFL